MTKKILSLSIVVAFIAISAIAQSKPVEKPTDAKKESVASTKKESTDKKKTEGCCSPRDHKMEEKKK